MSEGEQVASEGRGACDEVSRLDGGLGGLSRAVPALAENWLPGNKSSA